MRFKVFTSFLLLMVIFCGKKITPIEPKIDEKFLLEQSLNDPNKMKIMGWGSTKPYEWTTHEFGYLAPVTGTEPMAIEQASTITPDIELAGKRIKVTLDRLVAFDYPGSGIHNVLINFYAQNQSESGTEDMNFNQTFRIQEGSSAGISGYPVFRGLVVGDQGIAFKFFTVNVSNATDQQFLKILDSDAVKGGIELGLKSNPALKPLADISISFAKLILQRNEKRPVQDVYMGLDFSSAAALRARLKEGTYIVVQVKDHNSWNWSNIEFDPKNGRIQRKNNPNLPIENNYFVFSITKM